MSEDGPTMIEGGMGEKQVLYWYTTTQKIKYGFNLNVIKIYLIF